MPPVFFFGHGNPMHAIANDRFTQAWAAIGACLPKPAAILAISAHWHTRGTHVTAMEMPRTIHDFGGFPPALSQVQYPAPGNPALAGHIADLLTPVKVGLDQKWGIDHGTWSVLRHVFPNADIPLLQLSIDATQPPSFHYALGKRLSALRDEGVLIIGSGNIVHNLHAYNWESESAKPRAATTSFENSVRQLLLAGDHQALIDYAALGADARFAVPTPEHYLPLLYIIALQRDGEQASFPIEGSEGGSISMLTVEISQP
ncbi:4,5-DOPA dioxygenase extradiol [Sulfuriferula sp. AH1]|uniref:4,5-DOPA-extradiol-dioxygenase n=1 Tax=Sulfuriferula sp. AH1 TaxID=1985873 RepID=UPI000B3B608E|nr:4,5-DOPA dioxygenase extradiol [Sulfuriferula sp. AH1]ARU32631.1 4,5-DOPA dioxygenase extradiol [Sulfuriferula sp. AH1]